MLVENMALRPQIAVLERSAKRPRFTNGDRLFWVVRLAKIPSILNSLTFLDMRAKTLFHYAEATKIVLDHLFPLQKDH